MAICGNCGAETQRIRSRWQEDKQLPDECPKCAPQSFEQQTDPSDKKIWIGPEFAPNDYVKTYDEEGVIYQPKPEVTAEREAKAFQETGEQERYEAAVAEKRKERRTHPMSAAEVNQAIRLVDRVFRPLIEDPDVNYDA